jgi:hypothetical protein
MAFDEVPGQRGKQHSDDKTYQQVSLDADVRFKISHGLLDGKGVDIHAVGVIAPAGEAL